tara:strand:- start:7328 stop:7855 length:528 start_codon:yes stop_codon:yes gene_type:complete
MSLTFPTGIQSRPSALADLPNQFKRPVFEELYGFDAVSAVDNALLTESGNYILTESRAYLKFDLSAAIPPTSTYNNTDSSVVLVLDNSTLDVTVSWTAFPTALSYLGRFTLDGNSTVGSQTSLIATSSPKTQSIYAAYNGAASGTIVYLFLQAKATSSPGSATIKNYPRLSFTLP